MYSDELFVNQDMVEKGYAAAYEFNPDTTLCHKILDAEARAKDNALGIWAREE